MGSVPPSVCYEIDYNLIEQIQAADREGKTEMVLRVPKGDNHDNWPHPMYMAEKSAELFINTALSRGTSKSKYSPMRP